LKWAITKENWSSKVCSKNFGTTSTDFKFTATFSGVMHILALNKKQAWLLRASFKM
jgi:hypothetical protein